MRLNDNFVKAVNDTAARMQGFARTCAKCKTVTTFGNTWSDTCKECIQKIYDESSPEVRADLMTRPGLARFMEWS